jgi:glycine/D-amino acid oxidase-like deaminating enzyme
MPLSAPSASPFRLRTTAISQGVAPVEITCDGAVIQALPGESVAAALAAAGRWSGIFCGMGACDACRLTIDGVPGQRACLAKIRAGMRLSWSQTGAPAEPPAFPPLAPARHAELLVIGAGPAGLAAALAAACRGLSVTVLDERDNPGGQYFKPLASSHAYTGAPDPQAAEGIRLIDDVRKAGVTLLGESVVWHAQARPEGGATIGVVRGGAHETWTADRLVVATGAYEAPWMVPGWTLPGVITTGAAQTLVRSNRVAPGHAVLIAGNGPLNLQLAAELVAAGLRVVALVEAAPAPARAPMAALRMAMRAPRLIGDGVRQLGALRDHGVPILNRHVLVRAEGKDRIERAVVARLGPDGATVAGTERCFAVDSLCIGYGFLPANELTRFLGIRHEPDASRPGAVRISCDPDRRTAFSGIYAAGDAGGPQGARVAMAQGTLAGLAAADDSGAPPALPAWRRARRELRRAMYFQHALWQMFRSPANPALLATPDTVLCRCEGVTFDRVRALAESGASLPAVRRATRCGMGRCQGRYCGPVLGQLCGAATAEPGLSPQAPLRPVSAGALAAPMQHTPLPQLSPPARRHDPSDRRLQDAAITVIGGGIIGICTAYELARAGADVLLIERGDPNGEASGGNAGSLHVQLLGYAFDDLGSPAAEAMLPMLPLARDAAAAWEALATTLKPDIELRRKGGFSIAHTPDQVLRLRQKAALERRAGLQIDILSGPEARRLAPALAPSVLAAAFSPDEGQLNPQLAGPALLSEALRAGLRLLTKTEVLGMAAESGGYRLQTSAGTLHTGKVLNAAGPWSAQIASYVGITLPVRAVPLQMLVTEPLAPILEHLVAHVRDRLTIKQARNGNVLIGGGWRATVDPVTGRRLPTVDGLRGNLHIALQTIPVLQSARILRSWTAINAGTAGPPILSATPGHPGLVHAATLNGLSYGPIVGRICADKLLDRKPGYDISSFDLVHNAGAFGG